MYRTIKTVTEKQKQLAREKTDSLSKMFRDGLANVLSDKAGEDAMPILARIGEVLEAIAVDVDVLIDDAFFIAQVTRMRATEEV